MKYKDSNGSWQTIKVKNYGIEQTPIGSMIYYPSQNIPAGYLVCDGSEKLIADYPLLFNAIGYIGGEDVDTGYFRLPDMRGVVPGGYHSGLPSSNPLHGNFGDQVGNPTHTHTQGKTGSTAITIDQMPKHTHDFIYNQNNTLGTVSYPHATGGYGEQTTDKALGFQNIAYTGGGQGHTHTNPTTNSSSNIQPTKLYNWLIKAKNVVTLGGYTEDFEVTGDLNMLGKIILPANKYLSAGGAINMNNSDIINANCIYMNDEAEGHEGINFLKQGASSGSTNQDDYENLSGFGGNLYYNGTPVVDSGSNSNGTWIKWMDGTMICCKRVTGTVNITEQYYGYFYHTADDNLFDLGDYPQEFIELPRLNVQFVGGNCQWIGSIQNNDKLHIGDLHIISVTSKTAGAYYEVIAIGKWK